MTDHDDSQERQTDMHTISQDLPPVVHPGELAGRLPDAGDLRLLDVRTPGEFETVHIRGAYNVPLDTLGEHAREIRAHVADPVILVCQSGGRARQAEEALKAAGMANLHVLDGGINGWLKAGLPVVRGPKRVSLERQVRMVAGTVALAGGLLGAFVHPLLALLAAFVGGGLAFAGLTDTCAMGLLLARLPYNRPATCDVGAMVRALAAGDAPGGADRGPGRPAGAASCCPA